MTVLIEREKMKDYYLFKINDLSIGDCKFIIWCFLLRHNVIQI